MYCGKCGSPIPNGDSFCSKCGAPISQSGTQTTVNISPQPVPPTAQAPKPRTSALRVFEAIFAIAFAIIIMVLVLRACSTGMAQMGY